MTEENKNIETSTESTNTETHTTTASTKPTKRLKRKMNTNRPVYLYDFNGNFVGRFRGPMDAAKQLLGYGKGDVEDIYDSHKLSNLRYEISTYARSNANSHNGVTFVQGYVPSYKELNSTDIIGNRRTQTVRGNRVLQYDFDGNLIRVFKNAADAAENLGKSTAWVSILCNADFILRYDR